MLPEGDVAVQRFDLSVPAPRDPVPVLQPEDRSGPPLSQGFLFTMMATMAADQLSLDNLAFANQVDPTAWYHGQILDELLADLAQHDPRLPFEVGKTIFYAFKQQLIGFGIHTPAEFVEGIPSLWQAVTRGATGEWRVAMLAPTQARIEMDIPHDCRFEEGTVVGAMETLGAHGITILHDPCVRRGSPFCVFNLSWEV